MIDPIQWIVEWVYKLIGAATSASPMSGTIIVLEIVGFVILVVHAITSPRFNKMDKKWSDISGTLIDKLEGLLPDYGKAIGDYCKLMVSRVMEDKELMSLANSIDPATKLKAELDYCNHDIMNDEVGMSLIMQLKGLKGSAKDK